MRYINLHFTLLSGYCMASGRFVGLWKLSLCARFWSLVTLVPCMTLSMQNYPKWIPDMLS